MQNKSNVVKLTKVLSQRYDKRKGGYCRLLRAGFRYGDDAPMAIIELVDRDISAKKVDVKVKTDAKSKDESAPNLKEPKKKIKNKK